MNRLKRILLRTISFAKREFQLRTRYKWTYISKTIIMPLIHVAPLIILYWGLTNIVSVGLPEVTSENYLAWVLLGSVNYSTFILGYTVFRSRFGEEKYWMTIHGTLIAPVSKFYYLFGVVIELGVEALIMAGPFFIISFIVMPTNPLNVFIVFLVFLIGLITATGFSLINGTFYLVNENLGPLFEYFLYILVLFSTYLIPLNIYPDFLHFFVYINPFYHYINLSRVLWFGIYSIELLWSFLYIIVVCIICVVLGVYFFTRITRRFGIRGY